MYLEQHWLIYFFRQFLPCEHWHGFGTRANPSGRSRHPLIFAFCSLHFITASQTAGAGILLCVCVRFCWREWKCGFGCSEQPGPAGPLHPRVCAPSLLSLGGKSKMLRNAALCPALAWIPVAGNERDFYFSVTAIKLVWLYKVFRKFVVRSLIVQPCLIFPELWDWKVSL